WLHNLKTFNIIGDVPINSNAPASSLFDNQPGASLNKTGGAGIARIASQVNNAGGVSITSGQLAFNGGGSNGGSISIPNATNALAIEANTYVLAAGTSVNPAELGSFIVDGGTLNLTTPLALEQVELRAGTIAGSNLTINKKLTWSGGALLGPGTTTIPNTSAVDATALTQPISLDGRTLDNNALFKWNPGVHHFELVNGAAFNNNVNGTFEILGDRFIDSGLASTINNAGTIRKTGGVSGTVIHPALNVSAGTVSSEVNGQALIIAGGGSMTGGTLTTTGTALLDFFGGTFTATGGGISGTGTTRIVGGTLQINANVDALTTLALESGVLEVNSPSTFQITTFQWKGGTVQGGGTKRVFGGFIGNTAPTSLNAGILTIPATSFSYDADATNHLTILGSASLNIESGATMTVTGNGVIAGAAPARLSMGGGTLAKSGTGMARIDVPFDQTSGGTLSIADGILTLRGGGIMPRPIVLTAPTSRLEFALGNFDLGPGASVSGAGSILISGGIVNANTALTIPQLQLSAGVLQGTGAVSVGGGGWAGGTMDGTGTTTITGTFELSKPNAKTLRRPFVNNGTLFTSNPPVQLTLENGVTLINNATFDLQADTNLFCTCSPSPSTFVNAGTLQHGSSAANSTWSVPFNNNGTVDVQSGVITLNGTGTHSGDFTTAAITGISFGGPSQTFNASSSIGGDGLIGLGATNTLFSGTYALTGPTSLTLTQGNVVFNSASPVDTAALEIRTGALGGSSAINIVGGSTQTTRWRGGTISGSGPFTIAPSVIMTLDASNGALVLDGRTITNNGTMNYFPSPNTLTLTNNASIVNAGLFELQNDAAIATGIGTNTFVNNHTFAKSFGTGTSSF
ncbi:MAG TPA: hypothetical protein VHL59_14450, partial [Thermoanaerobaculia bacterium]|nr:hypothetical protein [Thermoanaerobaculia bacterium]